MLKYYAHNINTDEHSFIDCDKEYDGKSIVLYESTLLNGYIDIIGINIWLMTSKSINNYEYKYMYWMIFNYT